MARRRKKDELEPEQAVVLLLMIGAGWGAYRLTNSWFAVGVAVGCVIAAYVLIILAIKKKRDERLKRSGIAEIDKMEGRQFEIYLGHLFKAHGYDVEVTQAAGDFGADLVINKAGKKIVIQAKRYSSNVGIKAVQEAQASIAHYGASEAWVVSNSDYTAAAYTLAKSNGVRLINRKQLIEMILVLNGPVAVPAIDQVTEQSIAEVEQEQHNNDECERCGYLMVKRKGSRGEFYGCSNFPKCRHTQALQ
ncbi:hypothetical protein BK133_05315 [Paenibacillus sp. FSL H8-0548]|uniref:restriction endonuclease n=1 Tax=Paenibacillus sp. FSL H8-0548 TaxID=1920422 RepID=UPI00096BFDFD|nr:restriction endonuclease [Paenibacillus sp. FSL H8-0548]OMF37477.1 hypothetical protein BK133_05315 [Paenibacillus sp. FSL H8-0548]